MRWTSMMTELGHPAPDFRLPDSHGQARTLADVRGPNGLVVAFICNHCPFVLHLIDPFVQVAAGLAKRGIATVAISSNDIAAHPEDGPGPMAEFARARGFGFPYLYDETQSVAHAFQAACTPDLFLYDAQLRLYYRGQFDASRPQTAHTKLVPVPVAGGDLLAAAEALLAGAPPPGEQRASMGCSMKWKPGNEPEWS
ncbi:MAG: hypothetical protein RL684_3103 [Pseudomonadota bacterium]|jgi:peroxiredoxin